MTNTAPANKGESTPIAKGPRWLARAGLLVGLALLLPAALRPVVTLHPTLTGATCALAFVASGLAGLLLATALWNRALLRGRMQAELGRGNLAAGLVAGAHCAGSGIVAAHCFAADTLASLPVGAIFFVVAETALVCLSFAFRALTDYADDQEIMGENLAASISYGGLVLALSLIVGHAADGAFVGWIPALRSFALFLLWALLLYPVRQLAVARWLLGFPLSLRGGALDRAVAQDRTTIVSCVEAVGYLAAALLAMGLT
jgi:uncharacterized membrane protein YjfL (UPF0719 family)